MKRLMKCWLALETTRVIAHLIVYLLWRERTLLRNAGEAWRMTYDCAKRCYRLD